MFKVVSVALIYAKLERDLEIEWLEKVFKVLFGMIDFFVHYIDEEKLESY